ncbi:hypothetical protein C7458_11092 [Williamsia muralis]|nr:hypothetical protein C7458_11092 [Williamsia marianensis]
MSQDCHRRFTVLSSLVTKHKVPQQITPIRYLMSSNLDNVLIGRCVITVAGYRPIPDAATPATIAERERAIGKLLTVERHFLKSMGFYYKEVGHSWDFYRIKNDRLFDRRWDRAVQIAAARHADD